jgi:hypothetical protein
MYLPDQQSYEWTEELINCEHDGSNRGTKRNLHANNLTGRLTTKPTPSAEITSMTG